MYMKSQYWDYGLLHQFCPAMYSSSLAHDQELGALIKELASWCEVRDSGGFSTELLPVPTLLQAEKNDIKQQRLCMFFDSVLIWDNICVFVFEQLIKRLQP
jgi:hypothetical protein